MRLGSFKYIMLHNESIIDLTRVLNVRAGEEIFNVQPLHDTLNEVTRGGTRALRGIKEAELIYPKISLEMMDIIWSENPEQIEIDGRQFPVIYGWDEEGKHFFARVIVDEDLVNTTLTGKVILPGGRIIEIYCGGEIAENFASLRVKLKAQQRVDEWLARCGVYATDWITDAYMVTSYLRRAGVQVIMKHNDVSMSGYVSLEHDEKFGFKFVIVATRDEAVNETKKALLVLLELILRKELIEADVGYFGEGWVDMKFGLLFEQLRHNLNVFNFAEKLQLIRYQLSAEADEVLGWHQREVSKKAECEVIF